MWAIIPAPGLTVTLKKGKEGSKDWLKKSKLSFGSVTLCVVICVCQVIAMDKSNVETAGHVTYRDRHWGYTCTVLVRNNIDTVYSVLYC